MSKSSENKAQTSKPVIAREDDGTIQITFTIPFSKIEKARNDVILEVGRDLEVPGFRKGKAPSDKVKDAIAQNTLLEKTLSKILPDLLANVLEEHKLKLAIYPRFSLEKAKDGEDWVIRAKTCEIPEVKLGNYKDAFSKMKKATEIWTPDEGKKTRQNEPPREEKEDYVIKTLLQKVAVVVPKVLLEEETNSRLSRLLDRIEKLGLNLEGYLASIGKTADALRNDYAKEANDVISLDLILNKIAQEEKLDVTKAEIDEAIKVSSVDTALTKELESEEKRKLLEAVLHKRKALNFLVSLT